MAINDSKVIDAFGATSLVEVGNQYFLQDVDGAGPSLNFGAAAVVEGQFGTWNPIAVEQTADGGYQVVWKDSTAVQYAVWTTDGNGNFTGDLKSYAGGDAALKVLETSFHQDLNGDGQIGPMVVTTDHPDYAPGSTAVIIATEVTVGDTVDFSVAHLNA